MTTPAPEIDDELEQEPEFEAETLYSISFDRLVELKRSAVVVIAQRRVPTCPSLDTPTHELTDPQALVEEIADHYEDEDGFIRTDMSIQEIAFRLLLARRNEPISLMDLHYELTDTWSTPINPVNVSEEGLRRVLDADTYYGFAGITPES
jgi:hypothetical protein